MPWYKIPNRMPRYIRVKGGRKVQARANVGITPKLEIKPMRFRRGPAPPAPRAVNTNSLIGPFNLATSIAEGNFATRNYRQKPIVMLETATHTPNPNRMYKAQKVEIPMVVSSRQPKNNFSATITTMPVTYKKAYPAKKVSKKTATNRKNGPVKHTKKPFIPKVIKKELTDIKKQINVDKAKHTYKQSEGIDLKSLAGRCNHYNLKGTAKAELETAIANLRYYNPSVPGTLTTADASTGTYSRDVHFKNYYMKVNFRNNYQVPAKLKVYLCKVKVDNNETNGPLTTYTTAITDQVINAGTDETDALIYVNDIERVKEVWSVDCVLDKTLEPGQEASTSHSTGPFDFDPSHVDDFTNAYQQVFKSFSFLIRLEGVLGHDTAADEQSILPAGVDIQYFRKAEIEYDAGVALNDIYFVDYRTQTFTNGGVCSLKPVADNIAYSVS